ncbi:c-type cytochrome [Arenicella xantha]|uniref:Cytochrome c553 n=1 Tax=Arenicella xantha TaxID=644221 RepID=A0A395JJD0_9GAMM|nr:c-type cytochrome [Arenicella xantha]RBP48784.1 cytochrome c553 [Arenicella xantha]
MRHLFLCYCNSIRTARVGGLLVLAFSTLLQTSLAASSETGATLYQTSCQSCHGPDARGKEVLNSPALAGQSAAYLVRQLEHFSKGIRGGDGSDALAKQMRAISLSMTQDQDRQDLAEYLESLPAGAVTPIAGDTDLGYKLYQASCGGCHGGDAQGNELLNSPRLAGLSASYLTRQYQHFLDGTRGSDRSDKFGRQMKMIAATLKDRAQVEAVIAYISSIQP